MTPPREAPTFDPSSPEFRADPYPAYHRLRADDPVHRTSLGRYVVTRYDDVQTTLTDPRFVRAGTVVARGSEASGSMLMRDPPDHTRLRGLVSRAFTPRVIETLRAHVEEMVQAAIDRALAAGTMEVIEELAYPVPVAVICEMIGVPTADQGRVRAWSADLARLYDGTARPAGGHDLVERGRAAQRDMSAYLMGFLPERRARPRDDLLSALIAARDAGDRLSDAELLTTCVLLFVAGHETTANLIGNGLLALMRHPDQWDLLLSRRALIPAAVEELLRFDGPVQCVTRFTREDVQLAGGSLPKGAVVIAAIGAANRDPTRFRDPDRLLVDRNDNRHLAFGAGIHHCLGAALARMEGQVTLAAVLERMPGLRLAGEPIWREGFSIHGLSRLPVRF